MDMDMGKANQVKPCEFRTGRVQIDARLIAAGEEPAHYDPNGFGSMWTMAIRNEAEAKGLVFVPAISKEKMITDARLNGGKCATISIGSKGSPPKPPFTDNYAMRVAVTNDLCGDKRKAEKDPNGIAGDGSYVIEILVNSGVDSFWAQVLVSNCYPRAHLHGANAVTEIPKLKDVLFALGNNVPPFANLIDANDYSRCLDSLRDGKIKKGLSAGQAPFKEALGPATSSGASSSSYSPVVPVDDFNCIDGVTYTGGTLYQVHGLVNKPALNGELVCVATKDKWRENAAAHPGRVQVAIGPTNSPFFVKPANLRPHRDEHPEADEDEVVGVIQAKLRDLNAKAE